MFRRPAFWLLLAILIAFAPALLGGYVYDDQAIIVRNVALRNGDLPRLLAQPFWGADLGYWRPLPSLLMWLGDRLGGAAGIHALALLVHATATWLAFDIVRRLGAAPKVAAFAAACFALHPVQVESVAWCSAISDGTWSAAALAAVRALLVARERERAGPWAAALWWGAALCCKETAVVVPLLLWWVPRREGAAVARTAWAPLVVVFGLWWLLRALVFGDVAAGMLRGGQAAPFDIWRTVSAPAELLLRELVLLLVPYPLTPFRGFAGELGAGAAMAWLTGAVVLGVMLALAWRRSPPLVRFALACVLLPLLPTLAQFRAIGSFPIADRYLYLPAFGFGLLLALLLRRARGPWPWLLPALMAAMSFVQVGIWRDPASLLANGMRHAGDDPKLLVMSGDEALELVKKGNPKALGVAQVSYAAAEQRAATVTSRGVHQALAAARLGLAWCAFLAQQGRSGANFESLIVAFQRAVDSDDTVAAAWVGLGVANGAAGHVEAAERALRHAIELEPDNGDAWFNLGYLQAQSKRGGEARTSLQQALRCNPDYAAARDLLDRLR